MEILAEENVAATTAGVSQKLAGGSASTRKPRRALGDITNGGKSKLKLPQKTPGKTPGKGARGPKTPGAKAGSDPAMQVLQDGLKSLSIAPDAPDIEHAHLDDGAGIDWLKEDLGLDVDAMLGSVSACGGAIKSRGVPVGNAAPQAEACALSALRSRAAPPSRDRPLPCASLTPVAAVRAQTRSSRRIRSRGRTCSPPRRRRRRTSTPSCWTWTASRSTSCCCRRQRPLLRCCRLPAFAVLAARAPRGKGARRRSFVRPSHRAAYIIHTIITQTTRA